LYQEIIQRVINNVAGVMVGKPEVIELSLVAVLCEGHILVEDVPGIGKTMLAKSLASSLGCSFARIQCTPDLLPSDVTGIHIFNQQRAEFEFRPGPVMHNIILVDEINRATPRTQSSLLECMEEKQVTVDGVTMPLPRPFLIIATQNPVELHGTFPLPEAQLDRFLLKLAVGYPEADEEDQMLLRFQHQSPLEKLGAVTNAEEIMRLKTAAQQVHVEPSLRRYLLDIVRETRHLPDIELGASPRASLALFHAVQALALSCGRDFVIPDDIKRLAPSVLSHRLIASTETYLHHRSKESLIENILDQLPVPVEPQTESGT
jgi:MoxR-like ATPase